MEMRNADWFATTLAQNHARRAPRVHRGSVPNGRVLVAGGRPAVV